MFRVELHKRIQQILSVLQRIAVLHSNDTSKSYRLQIFYSLYYSLFPISLITGSIWSDDITEMIFLGQISFMSIVLLVKSLYMIWKAPTFLELLNRICVYDVDERDKGTTLNKLEYFMNFFLFFIFLTHSAELCIVIIVPFLGTEKKLLYNIGFPFDYKNDEFAYWIAFTYIFGAGLISLIVVQLSVIIWYLMATCGLRYQVLGQQMKRMGEVIRPSRVLDSERKVSHTKRDSKYFRDLIEAISSHKALNKYNGIEFGQLVNF